MRKLSFFLLFIGLTVVSMGCDSNDDDGADTNPLIGAWGLGGLADASGDRTAGFAEGFNSVVITFNDNGTMSMAVDSKVDAGDLNISGTYTVNTGAKSLAASLNSGGQTIPLTFNYEEVNGTTVRLSATGNTSILLGTVFATSLADPVTITVVRAG